VVVRRKVPVRRGRRGGRGYGSSRRPAEIDLQATRAGCTSSGSIRPLDKGTHCAPLMFFLPGTLALPFIVALGAYRPAQKGGRNGERLLAAAPRSRSESCRGRRRDSLGERLDSHSPVTVLFGLRRSCASWGRTFSKVTDIGPPFRSKRSTPFFER
jgi:hypothetical protein